MFKLLCVGGLEIGQEYDLERSSYVLGRSGECDIIVIDAEASRQHCRLIIEKDTAYLEDLGSTNGTFHNNHRVLQKIEIAEGDSVRIGNTRFQCYTQIEEEYIMSSTRAKANKTQEIDQSLREFTTQKLSLYDTLRLPDED